MLTFMIAPEKEMLSVKSGTDEIRVQLTPELMAAARSGTLTLRAVGNLNTGGAVLLAANTAPVRVGGRFIGDDLSGDYKQCKTFLQYADMVPGQKRDATAVLENITSPDGTIISHNISFELK